MNTPPKQPSTTTDRRCDTHPSSPRPGQHRLVISPEDAGHRHALLEPASLIVKPCGRLSFWGIKTEVTWLSDFASPRPLCPQQLASPLLMAKSNALMLADFSFHPSVLTLRTDEVQARYLLSP